MRRRWPLPFRLGRRVWARPWRTPSFTDVSTGTSHSDAINCIAYYGITVGRGDGTYGALADVTRSQMSLFLSGMAGKVGLELDDAMSCGLQRSRRDRR